VIDVYLRGKLWFAQRLILVQLLPVLAGASLAARALARLRVATA
jgi:hypothetical protein